MEHRGGCRAQVGVLGGVVGGQLAQRLLDEAAQVGAVGDQREEAVDAQAVEVGEGRLPVHLPPDVHGLERLVVGGREGRRPT